MKAAPANWILILHQGGRRGESFKLNAGVTTIGRDPSNPIPLPHSSVSRQHAEIVCGPDGVTVRDLDSRNGLLVNGVPRKKAVLQPGDKLGICEFTLELTTASAAAGTMLAPRHSLESVLRLDQTIDQRVRLPEARHERQLATLYHVCFWIAEGVEEKQFAERCLNLLLESLRAAEVHFYSADLELQSFAVEDGKKPAVKLAAFLAKNFQDAKEATAILGQDIARHQRGVGDFNYLVAPLRASPAAPNGAPFLVVVRAGGQQDFDTEDRVLLQAVCQLWVRGQAKTSQLQELRQENAHLKEKAGGPGLLGASPALQRLRAQALKAAPANVNVLITGETGSGKEVLAQFIHDNSPRRHGPLVMVNCAAIPDSLIESELFGYCKGAFSGADRDYHGKFVQANGGTLFLDEIGEMPLLVQSKVLRAIEKREVQLLRSETTTHLDLRILAATNRDLKEMVRQKQFREDLYFRLHVQSLRVPPLREHLEDIEELANHFLKKFCDENGLAAMAFDPEAIAALKDYAWPGNVRELWNVVQRCALSAGARVVTRDDAASQLQESS